MNIAGGHYLVVTVRDISDQKRRRSLERIFFHDILNTAGSLSGYAELLVDATGRDIDEFRATIQNLADQILEEIQAQQSLAMAEHGELKPIMRPLTTDHLIRTTVRKFERTAEAQGKSIRIVPMEERLVVFSDEVLLRRVLGNMVKNAIEATRTGTAVTIGCSMIGSRARFWVQNPEVMTQDVQLQVFQRSFSTKGRDRGLGTYSMKLLVERYLAGQVGFESSMERGTVFCADIPLSPALN
jgi:signal transduction histidine kinase